MNRVADLSEHSSPLTQLFPSFDRNVTPEQFALNERQLRQFDEEGYIAGIPILDDEAVELLRTDLDRLADPKSPGNELFYEFHSNESSEAHRVLFHALGGWRISPAFHDLLWHPAITVPASQLLGGAVRFWHDQLFCKPARHGGVVAWHQDYSYWTRTQPMAHLTCWIGLDDADEENGCLQYIPGSHRWDLLPVTGLAGDMDAIQTVLSTDQRAAFQPVPVRLKRGEAAFHHPLMVHGSYANETDRQRRAVVINMVRDGVCSQSNEPLLDGVPVVPAGERLEGQFFPLLYQPAELQ